MSRYLPGGKGTRFLRFQLADFDPVKADHMWLWTFDRLIEFKWMRRANTQYSLDHSDNG